MLTPILRLIQARFRARTGENLAAFVSIVPVHREQLAGQAHWVFAHKDTLSELLDTPQHLDTLIAYSVDQVKAYVYDRNQYLDLSPAARRILRSRYAAYYSRIRTLLRESDDLDAFTRGLESETVAHLATLSCGLRREVETCASTSAAEAYLQTVACAEYSAEQQLAMLGIDVEALRPPVLDLGCGAQAALCRDLHARGVAVLGIDRMAPALPFCRRIGWAEWAYGAMTWGTIISHHAFSTHFHFHHRHSEQKAAEMAVLCMNILNSLQPGGTFIYTPGLPFIEPFIAGTGRFDLRTVAIADAPPNLQAIAYAGHIRRKPG